MAARRPSLLLFELFRNPGRAAEGSRMSDGSNGGPFIPLKTFHWGVIDHRLVRLKLTDLGIETRNRIKKDESRIRFENRLNTNTGTAHYQVLKMKVDAADEWARRVYEIYCAVWQTQGYEKSAAFVRAVARTLSLMLGGRASSMAHAFLMYAKRTNFPGVFTNAHLKELRLRMRQLQSKWERQLEAEARECEHAARRNTLTAAIPPGRSSHGEPRIPIPQFKTGPADEARLAEINKRVQKPETYKTLTVPDSGLYFGVEARTVYRWVDERKLKSGARRGSITIESIREWEKKRARKRRSGKESAKRSSP